MSKWSFILNASFSLEFYFGQNVYAPCQFLSPRCRDSLWVARSLQRWSNSQATWEHYVEGVLFFLLVDGCGEISELPGWKSPKGFQGCSCFFCVWYVYHSQISSRSGGVWWVKKRANFLQKRLRFNQNTFEHDGLHIKNNRKHICLLSALHLISWLGFSILFIILSYIFLALEICWGRQGFKSTGPCGPSTKGMRYQSGVDIMLTSYFKVLAMCMQSVVPPVSTHPWQK